MIRLWSTQMAGYLLVTLRCILSEIIPSESFYQNIIWNGSTEFTDVPEDDYTFSSSSDLNGNGVISTVFSDILGNPRMDPPDIGAYEVN